MEFSQKLTNLIDDYQLTSQAVAFAALIAAGLNQAESYELIYRPNNTSFDACNRAGAMLRIELAGVNRLIQDLQKNRERKGETIRKREVKQLRDKDAIISEFEQLFSSATLSDKERAAVLTKVADLQNMKKEESVTEEERVHYYLPLRCQACSLFQQSKKKQC